LSVRAGWRLYLIQQVFTCRVCDVGDDWCFGCGGQ
jgi:hypothetical protein